MRAQNGTRRKYKASPHELVHKLVSAYTKDMAIKASIVAFVHEGLRLAEQQTFQSNGLEDGDVIDCVITQRGD